MMTVQNMVCHTILPFLLLFPILSFPFQLITEKRQSKVFDNHYQQKHYHQNFQNRHNWVRPKDLYSALKKSSSADRCSDTDTTTTTMAVVEPILFSSSVQSKKNIASSLSPYPTARGSEIDSRKIVMSSSTKQHIVAVRVKHIVLATQEMADYCMYQLRNGGTTTTTTTSFGSAVVSSFSELAKQVSLCTVTRDHGGEIGWINLQEQQQQQQQEHEEKTIQNHTSTSFATSSSSFTTASATDKNNINTLQNNSHLDTILPPDARKVLLQITTKPGDICTVQSNLGYHIVQIVDIMVDVRKLANTYKRRRPISVVPTTQTSNSNNKKNNMNNNYNDWLDPNTRSQLTYKMETMGCQMNMADSERIEGQLQSLGIQRYVDVDDDDDINKNDDTVGNNVLLTNSEKRKKKRQQKDRTEPDIIIFNTCSIRDHAEQKVYSYIGPYAKRKRDGQDVTIVVAGCVAQQEGKQLLSKVPEIDLIIGPQYANRIGDLLEHVRIQGNQVVATESEATTTTTPTSKESVSVIATDATHIMEDTTQPRRLSTTCAWVNVIYGCNERCTFCIVPTTRGIEQSRPVDSIVAEVTDLIQKQNYKEITLLGQNIDAYGRDMIPKTKFSDLLRIVGTIPGLQRLRFVTSHPRYMSMSVIDAVAETPSICESFHIPFQSGSNTILHEMGRGYTREKYIHIVNRIRSKIPEASITADVIVGFPGETEDDFLQTLLLMNEIVFDSVNTAMYSPRPNTPAALYSNQIPEHIKKERLQRINSLNKQHAYLRRQRYLHQTVEVLIEEINIQYHGQVMGRTRTGYIVYCHGNIDTLRGTLVQVRIEKTETYYLYGTIVE